VHSVFLAASVLAAATMPPPDAAASASQTPAPPRIVSLTSSANHVKSGERLTVSVVADSTVTSVTANFVNRTLPFTHDRPNQFSFSYKVPWVPFFVKGRYSMKVVASNAAGASVTRDLTIVLE
jgi:hypothetical protein